MTLSLFYIKNGVLKLISIVFNNIIMLIKRLILTAEIIKYEIIKYMINLSNIY